MAGIAAYRRTDEDTADMTGVALHVTVPAGERKTGREVIEVTTRRCRHGNWLDQASQHYEQPDYDHVDPVGSSWMLLREFHHASPTLHAWFPLFIELTVY